jgi:hypothetical protein
LVFAPLFAFPLFWQWKVEKGRPKALASLAVVILIAGPWYLRNLILYRSLSGNVESTAGVTLSTWFASAVSLPWVRVIRATAHSGMWTGNNSFTTFSATTINIVLVGLVGALLLYALRMRKQVAEIVTAAALALGIAALVGTAVTFYTSSKGLLIGAMPWYVPLLGPALLPLCALGMSRSGNLGKWLGVATALLWTYVALATWLVKLVPLYGGMTAGPMRQVLAWYRAGEGFAILRTLSPAPPLVLMTLITFVVGLAIASCAITIRSMVVPHAD